MNFKVGQRVVFVDCDLPRNPHVVYPELHEVVTISYIGTYGMATYFLLSEYPTNKLNYGINGIFQECFRPLNNDFAEEALSRIEKEIDEEQIILV